MLRTLIGHAAPAYAAAWRPDGTQLVSGGNDGLAIVWDAATGRRIRTLKPGRPGGSTPWPGAATASRWPRRRRAGFIIYDAVTGKRLQQRDAGEQAYGVALSPDGTLLSGAFEQGAVTLSPLVPRRPARGHPPGAGPTPARGQQRRPGADRQRAGIRHGLGTRRQGAGKRRPGRDDPAVGRAEP